MPNLVSIASGMLVLACALLPLGADAQTFPSMPIRLIVPTAPGPGVDLVGRQIRQKLAEDLGQAVVVENRPGASGIIGAEQVVRSPGDGHTILLATPSMVVTVVYLMKSLPFDPVKDLAPITAAVEPATAIVVNPSVPANNVKELIDWVKRNPGKVSYGSAGVGSVFHMVGELFNRHRHDARALQIGSALRGRRHIWRSSGDLFGDDIGSAPPARRQAQDSRRAGA